MALQACSLLCKIALGVKDLESLDAVPDSMRPMLPTLAVRLDQITQRYGRGVLFQLGAASPICLGIGPKWLEMSIAPNNARTNNGNLHTGSHRLRCRENCDLKLLEAAFETLATFVEIFPAEV